MRNAALTRVKGEKKMNTPKQADENAVGNVEQSGANETELNENELNTVSGGLFSQCCTGKHIPSGTITV